MDAASLARLKTPEGYIAGSVRLSGRWVANHFYYRKDHLGNNREVWRASNNSVIQRTQYYASGLPWYEGENPSWQPYKYNDKEFMEMHGYDSYDYGARMMYPAIMRFITIDPLAEKYYSISPYAYCLNNPVRYIDPNGMDIYIMMGDGRMVLALKTEDKTDQLYAFNYKENKMKSITVNDQGLLPQLWNGPKTKSNEGNYGTTSNADDAFNVFKFAADHTTNEWTLYKNKSTYTLGTVYESDYGGNPSEYNIENPTESLHSHPDVNTNVKKEELSMGVFINYDKTRQVVLRSDWNSARTDIIDNGKQTISKYVYFPNSKRLYHVGYNGPKLINNVKTSYKELQKF